MRGPGNPGGYPSGGLRRGGAARGPFYPADGAAFTARTGRTLTALYTFQEASGALDDKAGANDLSANGTPTFAYVLDGRQGINYDADADRHAALAAALDPGAGSFLAFAVYAFPHGAFASIMGGYDSSAADEGWLVYENSGRVKFDVRDTGANSIVIQSSVVSSAATLHMVSIQVDRTANTLRARVTPKGSPGEAISGSIAGFGSLSAGVNHLTGFGGMPLLNSSAVFYGGIEIGASAEGTDALLDLHRSMGWE